MYNIPMAAESKISFEIPLSSFIPGLKNIWIPVKSIPVDEKRTVHFAGKTIISFPQPNESIPGKFEIHIDNSREMFNPNNIKLLKSDRRIVFPHS